MWDFHPIPPLEQSTPPLNQGSTPFSFEVLVIFYYAFEAHNTFVRHLRILLTWLSLGHDSDTTMVS